jgi:hypothetical protein
VVVLTIFTFTSPASALIMPPNTETLVSAGVGNPVPVVILVVDELPVQTLLDADGNIDESRYPGFASLLDDFTWYRNTATMYQNTHQVLPVIVTGSPAQPDVASSAEAYPDSLFSLMSGAYDVRAYEWITALCAPEVCREQHRPSVGERWSLLLKDASIIGAHVGLPDLATSQLPSLTGTWMGFGTHVNGQSPTPHQSEQERDAGFNRFLEVVDEARPFIEEPSDLVVDKARLEQMTLVRLVDDVLILTPYRALGRNPRIGGISETFG